MMDSVVNLMHGFGHALTPDYAGCRPKLSRRGEAAADFRIDSLRLQEGITAPRLVSRRELLDHLNREIARADRKRGGG